jgi:hypothetical protein
MKIQRVLRLLTSILLGAAIFAPAQWNVTIALMGITVAVLQEVGPD